VPDLFYALSAAPMRDLIPSLYCRAHAGPPTYAYPPTPDSEEAYPEHYDLALSYGLDPTLRPTKLDISETVRWLGYKPSYSLASLLSELAAYGDSGPPQLTQA
jgi:hypothetical protein